MSTTPEYIPETPTENGGNIDAIGSMPHTPHENGGWPWLGAFRGSAIGGARGTVIGVVATYVTITAVGLSPAGPVAGGLFAANMGAGLAAGSWMALAQSAVMTGSAYYFGATAGAAAGTAAGGVLGAQSSSNT